MYEKHREVAKNIVEHPREQDVAYYRDISDKMKEKVEEFKQQYEDFKIKISGYTISSWRGLRVSHKIVLGAYWHKIMVRKMK